MPPRGDIPTATPRTYVVLVCGSRFWNDEQMVRQRLNQELAVARTNGADKLIVVDGCAPGADAIAAAWTPSSTTPPVVEHARFAADWVTNPRSGGPLRNKEMLAYLRNCREDGANVIVLAFKDGFGNPGGGGTEHMVTIAKQAGFHGSVMFHADEPSRLDGVEPLDYGSNAKRLLNTAAGRRRVVINLFWMWGHRCHYCGIGLGHPDEFDQFEATGGKLPDNFPTIDHFHPKALGGDHRMSNLRLACPTCNRLKDSKPSHAPEAAPWAFQTPSTDCPKCASGGTVMLDSGKVVVCNWCDGRGQLTAQAACAILDSMRHKVSESSRRRSRAVAETQRLRRVLADVFEGNEAHVERVVLADKVRRLESTIAHMGRALKNRADQT